MKVNCVDISTWNTGVNYRAVRSDGIIAAILRAGYGRETSQEDSRFETHYKGCRDAGLKVGVYWYSYADSVDDAEQEARACLSVLGGRHLDLPVYFDMEESWQTSMGRGTLTAMAKRFSPNIPSTLPCSSWRRSTEANSPVSTGTFLGRQAAKATASTAPHKVLPKFVDYIAYIYIKHKISSIHR